MTFKLLSRATNLSMARNVIADRTVARQNGMLMDARCAGNRRSIKYTSIPATAKKEASKIRITVYNP